MLSFGEASALAGNLGTRLLAIDGLPCSGKSTLARKVVEETGFQCIGVDDFFQHYEDFLPSICELAENGRCSYYPFDWDSMQVSPVLRSISLADAPVVVEGTSSLHPVIAPLFDVRFFVESDETSILEAVLKRDGDYFEKEWRDFWLPNALLYMKTKPRERADFIVAGRGVRQQCGGGES